MWRPDDWECKYLGKKANRYYELGADAMYEEVLKLINRLGYGRVVDDIRIYTLGPQEEE